MVGVLSLLLLASCCGLPGFTCLNRKVDAIKAGAGAYCLKIVGGGKFFTVVVAPTTCCFYYLFFNYLYGYPV